VPAAEVERIENQHFEQISEAGVNNVN